MSMSSPNILVLSPIRTSAPENDWSWKCHVKDVLWARNKQIAQIHPQPVASPLEAESYYLMKSSINDILMADVIIIAPSSNMISDVHLRANIASSIGCPVVVWDENTPMILSDMF